MLQLLQPTKVRVLFQLDPNTGFKAGVISDDTKFGLNPFSSLEKFALVSDTDWINNTVRMLGLMISCPVKLFALSERTVAKEWISGKESEASVPSPPRLDHIERVSATV